jgi:hypothetical protein
MITTEPGTKIMIPVNLQNNGSEIVIHLFITAFEGVTQI